MDNTEQRPQAGLWPPPEHFDKLLHWVRFRDYPATAARWYSGIEAWSHHGSGRVLDPQSMAETGFSYLGPAEYRAPAFWEETAGKAHARISVLEAANATMADQLADLVADNADLVSEITALKAQQAIRDVDKASHHVAPNTTGATKDKPMPGKALGFGRVSP